MSEHTIAKKKERTGLGVHIFFWLFGLCCLIPFLMIISASFSNDLDLFNYGYRVIPKRVDLTAYRLLFKDLSVLVNAYKITIFVTVTATFLSMIVMSMAAYTLARKSGTILGKVLTYYLYFPCLFSGGLVPSYIINTQYLHLTNNLAVLIFPALVGAFSIFMIRTFIQQQPVSLLEAAKIDGASEFGIYLKVAVPLAKPVLATVAFNTALGNWNQWYESMIYIRSAEKITLQHLLQRMMMNYQTILRQIEKGIGNISYDQIPGESMRMAMLVIAIGPMMCFFPFFQKYFVKGMVVGAVKG